MANQLSGEDRRPPVIRRERLATYHLLLCLTIFVLGCNSNAPEPGPVPGAASDSDRLVSADAKARAIAAKDTLFAELSGRLMEVMQAEGPVKAIEVCSKEANEIAQSVSKEQDVRIGRTSLKLRNPKNKPPEWARKLFVQKAREPQFTYIDSETVGALLPIKLQAKCLMCHGPADSLVPGVPEQLAKLYPNDQATGFSEGDLRGWFWVEVPAKMQPKASAANRNDHQALIQFGKMREVIGQKKHHGRVNLAELNQTENLYAVGAIEGLTGEVTIVDGKVIATRVNDSNELSPIESTTLQATLLVGKSVSQWHEFSVESKISPDQFDAYLAKIADESNLDLSKPTVFTIEGEFTDCCFHVINGACPVHAKRRGVEMNESEEPYQSIRSTIRGTLVGVYARDAAGVITHPGMDTHTHIVYSRPEGPEKLTAHVESVGLKSGSVVRIAKHTSDQ